MSGTDGARTYVLAEEFGFMCVIPRDRFVEAWLDAEAAYRVIAAGEVGLADIDDLSGGIRELEALVREYIEEFLALEELLDTEGEWNLESAYSYLGEGEMPDDWHPSDEQLASIRVTVPDTFYESSGLRAEHWAAELPSQVVEDLGGWGGGFFGDYFGFRWEDEAAVREALEALGHEVVAASEVVSWPSGY